MRVIDRLWECSERSRNGFEWNRLRACSVQSQNCLNSAGPALKPMTGGFLFILKKIKSRIDDP